MPIKNRPTNKSQFNDFIDRVAPFDGNPLVQKLEHKQVISQDAFDSLLFKQDNEQLINSPGAAINLDFLIIDLYNINTQGSVATNFTININNLSTGQIGRIQIVKKVNDVFSFSAASIVPIPNISQSVTGLEFQVFNCNNQLFALSNLTINKSDEIATNSTNQLATSKAVRDLNNIKANSTQENWIPLNLLNGAIETPGAVYEPARRAASYYKDAFGRVWLTGVITAGAQPLFILPVNYRPLFNIQVSKWQIFNPGAGEGGPRILTNGEYRNVGPGAITYLDGVSFTTHN